MPRVLIADDDPISLQFLSTALRQFGCESVGAASVADALHAAAYGAFELLLLDQRLPDGSGVDLLAALRQRGISAPAIATSAQIDAETATALSAAGFVGHLDKPTTLARLEQVLAPFLPAATAPSATTHPAPVALDDASALAVIGGDRDALKALRTMLAQELTILLSDLAAENFDRAALPERLHRLRAACGFCGTAALATAAADLEQRLRAAHDRPEALQEFARCCRATLAALDARSIAS